MINIYRSLTVSVFVTILFACSSSSDDDSENGTGIDSDGSVSAFNVSGDSRLARVERTSATGDVLVTGYSYNDDGRIQEIAGVNNGELIFTLVYSYDENGRALTRLQDRSAVEDQDTIREYVYDVDLPVGYFLFDVGEVRPKNAVRFRYSDNQIVGFDFKDLDPLLDNPTLADGTLANTGTLTISDSGNVTSLIEQAADGSNMRITSFVTNAVGQRISDETLDSDGNTLFTSVWEYEAAPCIEFPQGTLSQWLCVQTL